MGLNPKPMNDPIQLHNLWWLNLDIIIIFLELKKKIELLLVIYINL